MRTPFLTCIYLFIFLKISVCLPASSHTEMESSRCWFIGTVQIGAIGVLACNLYAYLAQNHTVFLHFRAHIQFTSWYLPLVSHSIIAFQVFPLEKLWFRVLFSECADLFQAPLPVHVATFFLTILCPLFVAFLSLTSCAYLGDSVSGFLHHQPLTMWINLIFLLNKT